MLHTLHSCTFDSHRLLFEGIIPLFFNTFPSCFSCIISFFVSFFFEINNKQDSTIRFYDSCSSILLNYR